MKRFTIAFITISTLLAVCVGAKAQVQKWIDADGKTHYGSSAPSNTKSKVVDNAPFSSSLGTSRVSQSKRSTSQELSAEPLAMSDPKLQRPSSGNTELVKLYTTSWCGYCKKARAYMAANGIRYQEFDIEADRFAKSDYQRHRGRGVPLLVKGDKTLRGFRSSSYDSFFAD